MPDIFAQADAVRRFLPRLSPSIDASWLAHRAIQDDIDAASADWRSLRVWRHLADRLRAAGLAGWVMSDEASDLCSNGDPTDLAATAMLSLLRFAIDNKAGEFRARVAQIDAMPRVVTDMGDPQMGYMFADLILGNWSESKRAEHQGYVADALRDEGLDRAAYDTVFQHYPDMLSALAGESNVGRVNQYLYRHLPPLLDGDAGGDQADGPEPPEGDDPPAEQGSGEGEGVCESNDADDEPDEEFTFVQSGNGYEIKGFGEAGHLAGLKGLGTIARLIGTPGKPVSMRELMGADDRMNADQRTPQPVLDAEAKRKIKKELEELRIDLAEAEAENNTVEADSARSQIETYERHLIQAEGIGGRDRDLNNDLDRLRPAIHGRLKTAYAAMRKAKPPMLLLAEHFELTLSSEGGDFVYRPGPTPLPWNAV